MKLANGLAVSVQGLGCGRGQVVNKPVRSPAWQFPGPTLLPWRTTLETMLLALESRAARSEIRDGASNMSRARKTC